MINTRFALALVLAFLLCPNYALAQQNSSQTATATQREKAFNLLESAAGQLGGLQSPENRARLGANIADSLWEHDEKRARAVIALVEDDIKAGLANRDLKDPQDSHTIKVFLKLRLETVERIAKYDAERALAFLKATEFISENPLQSEFTETETDFEMRLARQAASNNPAIAVKLARQSLDQGFSPNLILVLRRLTRKDKEQTLILYKEIVNKLRDADLPGDWAARKFAENLAQTFSPPTTDKSVFRELIGIIITSALDQGCGNPLTEEDPKVGFCRWAASILPQMARIDPRASQLSRWTRDALRINLSPEAVHEWYDLTENGNIESMVTFALKHPDIAQDLFWDATRRAGRAGDLELARKILTQYVADSEKKQVMLEALDRRLKSSPPDVKNLEEIQTSLKMASGSLERVRSLLSYANYYAYDRNTALRLVKQASEIIDEMKPGREQVEAQIGLARFYCTLKNDRGFAIMESLMPKLNELVDAAVKLDGYETRYVRDGEWNMSANGTVGGLLTYLSKHAADFAWCDFDRAVSLAAQFDRTEIRLMAQVKLAQAILTGPPQPKGFEINSVY